MSQSDPMGPNDPDARAYRIKPPSDGVYQVRLVGQDPANTASLAFTGGGAAKTVNLKPGPYTAWIEPLSGSSSAQELHLDAQGTVQLRDEVNWGLATSSREAPARPSWAGTVEAKAMARESQDKPRPFVIAMSLDERPGELGGWRGARPPMVLNDADGAGLVLQLKRPTDWRSRYRWRLTIAIGGRGPWRVPLPLFRGGLQIAVSPVVSPTGPDVGLTLSPADPVKAALVASLHRMFGGSATEVVRAAASAGVPGTTPVASAVDVLSDRLDDPWAAAAAALLMARSGEIDKVEAGARRLYSRFPWLPDVAVVVAWADAGAKGPRGEVEARCFEGIKKARIQGATYFIAADALVTDMLTGLSMAAADDNLRKAAREELGVWTRRSRRRMHSGPFLSWEDPPGKSDLQLTGKDYDIVCRGCLTLDKVLVDRKTPRAMASKLRRAPAFSRPVTQPDDHNKGRFGGKARVEGYVMEASFGRAASDWVRITITVKAPETNAAPEVELFLHDTFDPDHVTIPFNSGEASFTTFTRGGFTVGAWIAGADVELELDLAKVKGAPRAVVEN